MINSAIHSLIVQSSVSVNGIFPSVGDQDTDYPYVVYNSVGSPEDSKGGFDVKHYTVQVDVYAAKEKTKQGGITKSEELAEIIKEEFINFSGTISGANIDNILVSIEKSLFDPFAQAGRTMVRYRFRVNI